MEEFAWEGACGAWFFEGDGFGADGNEAVAGMVVVEIGVEGACFDAEGGVFG